MAIQYNCNFEGTIPFSDVAVQIGLTAGVEQTYTVPGGPTIKYQALFSYTSTSNVFVRLNGAITVPPGATVGTEQYNEFRPEKRYVQGGDVVHFKTPDATQYVGLTLRQLPG